MPRQPKPFKPLEVSFILEPHNPQDQVSVEDLTGEAEERLIAALKSAGFTVVSGPMSREA